MERKLQYLVFCFLGCIALLPIFFVLLDFVSYEFHINRTQGRLNVIIFFEVIFIIWGLFVLRPVRVVGDVSLSVWLSVFLVLALSVSKFSLSDIVFFGLDVSRTVMLLGQFFVGLLIYSAVSRISLERIYDFVAASVILGALLYIIIVAGVFYLNGAPQGPGCATQQMPGFNNVRYTGYFVSVAMSVALGLASVVARRWSLAILFIVLVGFWVFVFYTGTRGAIFAVLGTAIFSIIVIPRSALKRYIALAVVSSVVGYLCFLLLPASNCPGFGAVERLIGSVSSGRITSGRLEVWKVTIELIKERPFLGYGEIQLFRVSDLTVTQPHNFFLQTVLTWGLLGAVVVWYWLFVLMFRLIYICKSNGSNSFVIVLGAICILIYSLIDASLYYSYPILIFGTLVSAESAILRRG